MIGPPTVRSVRAFAAPGRYIQGPGALDLVGDLLRSYGGRPIVVLDPFVEQLLGQRIRAMLDDAGVRPVVRTLEGEITYAQVDRILSSVADLDVAVAAGIGGGKVLDAAKAVALRRSIPVMMVPSIASNDSPASAAIAMYDDAHTIVSVDRLTRHPDFVVVDTELIAQAPTAFLRSGIGDAISKRFEAAACRAGTGLTPVGTRPLRLAGAIADACYATIRRYGSAALRACDDGVVSDELESVVEAVILMGGLGFENGGLSLAHSLTRGLVRARGAVSAMHGMQVAWGLLVQLAAEGGRDSEIDDLIDFYRDVDLPVDLGGLGMPSATEQEIQALARLTMTAPHLRNMPADLSTSDVAAAIVRIERLANRAVGA